MKHTAPQAGGVVVEIGLGHDVHQISRQQPPQLGVTEGVGGAVVKRMAGGGHKQAAIWIQLAGGDRPQGHVGVGGAALAQVHLNRLHIPAAIDLAGNEIHRIALQAPFTGQGLTHRPAMAHQLQPVGIGGRKATTQVGLPARTPQDLLVGGEHLHRPTGINRALHTRRAERLAAFQPGLHQGTGAAHQLAPGERRHRQGLQGLADHPAPFGPGERGQLERF